MSDPALEEYLAGVDARAAPLVRALDRVITGVRPDFDVAVKYRILMYTLGADWRTWVCAIDAARSGVHLRFLYGVLLDDPLGVLRAGSSVLKTWDFRLDDVVDLAAVGAYVEEAVAKRDAYRADTAAVLERSRATARSGRRPRPGA